MMVFVMRGHEQGHEDGREVEGYQFMEVEVEGKAGKCAASEGKALLDEETQ